jgi:tRNA pseudouridine38-40 synthase
MRNYKLIIEYDGRDFCGWQIQPNLRTVQGELEKVLHELTGKRVNLVCGGRTDSGVHAYGQCANFKSTIDWGEDHIRKAIDSNSPDDITIVSCQEVDQDFHARFSATARNYCFRIYNNRSSIRRNHYWQYPEKINFACLKRLSQMIIGEHDFRSFCVKKSQKESNFCMVKKSHWTKKGKEFTFQISSNRFLHGMVRSLVGTMIKISAGFMAEKVFEELITNPKRSEKVFTAPPGGLYLMKIDY